MTASKMKKCPILASDTKSSSLLPTTNHKQQNRSLSSTSSSSSLFSLSSSSSNNYCGKKSFSSSTTSSCNERIFNNYRSSVNEHTTMIDGYADKQVESLFDETNNNLESRESKLHLANRHAIKHHTIEANTMSPHSFPSNEQHNTIVNKV